MRKSMNFLAVTALAGGTALMALPAQAVTPIVTAVYSPPPGGDLDLSNPIGTILGMKLKAGQTYDFTFSTDQGPLDVLSQVQAAFNPGGVAEDIQFTLYNGTPGSGTAVGTTGNVIGPVLDEILQPGAHYIEIDTITKNMELVSGSIDVSAVPEPATWIGMIFGFGILGGALRYARNLGRTSASTI